MVRVWCRLRLINQGVRVQGCAMLRTGYGCLTALEVRGVRVPYGVKGKGCGCRVPYARHDAVWSDHPATPPGTVA